MEEAAELEEDLTWHQRWFGPPWPRENFRAPVCEDDRLKIPTPVGILCCNCQHQIVEGDNGVATLAIGFDATKYPTLVKDGRCYSHRECSLRSVLGCSAQLRGEPCDHEGDYREDALRVEAWVQRHGI